MIITVIGQKGGTGKTTTAATIAAGLGRRRKHVLLIDLDAQCNLSLAVGCTENINTIEDVLIGRIRADEAITTIGEYNIIPGRGGLVTLELHSAEALKNAIEPAAQQFDFIVIDTPPNLSLLTLNALTAAHAAIIPVQADLFSLQSLNYLSDTINAIRGTTNPDLRILGILINRYNSRAKFVQTVSEHLNEAAATLGTTVFQTPIRESVIIKEAQACQKSIFAYAPKSKQAADFSAVIKEILKRVKNDGKA